MLKSLLFSLLPVAVLADSGPEDEAALKVFESQFVTQVSSDNFEAVTNKDGYGSLVYVYAPWCGHCKKLAPEYNAAAEHFSTSGQKVILAKIDATKNEALAQELGVQGYPSLFWFSKGKKAEFTGGRTKDEIISWIGKAVQEPVNVVEKAPEPTTNPVVVLTGESETEAFEDLADTKRFGGASFYFVKAAPGAAKLTLQHPGEELINFTGDVSNEEEVTKFYESHSLPLFGEITKDSYSKYMAIEKGMIWIFPKIEKSEQLKSAAEEIRPIANKIAKSLPNYSVVFLDTIMFKNFVENKYSVTSYPSVALNLKATDAKKFIYENKPLDAEKLIKWVHDAETGKVEAKIKSQPVPEKNDDLVRTIVAKNLEKEVFQKDKDVMFEVYAPWCGHCKKLEPEYEKVAKRLKKEGLDNVLTLAKMDGTENDSPVESIEWQGFPTIFYVKAGTTEPIPFDGGRDAKGIWKWISENHSNKALFEKKKKETKEDKKEEEL